MRGIGREGGGADLAGGGPPLPPSRGIKGG